MEKVEIQHGDLILKEVLSIPAGAKKIKLDKSFIVEKGEGVNTHEVATEGLEVYEFDGTLYLKPSEKVTLSHTEHGPQTLEPGKIYKKVNEREFSYEEMEARKTID